MPATTKDRQEFAAVVAREFPHLTPDDVASTCRDLVRLATHHGRMAEDACNRKLTDAENRRIAQTETRIAEIAERLGCGVALSGDPRGYTVKIRLPSGRSNSFGGDGWGVPQ